MQILGDQQDPKEFWYSNSLHPNAPVDTKDNWSLWGLRIHGFSIALGASTPNPRVVQAIIIQVMVFWDSESVCHVSRSLSG